MEWLVTNATSMESAARAKRAILGIILAIFWPIQAAFMVGEPLCDVRIPLEP